MSGLEMALWFVLAIIAVAIVAAIGGITLLLVCAARAEKAERAIALAEHDDQALDVARAEPWTGDNVTVPPSPAIVAGDDITTYQASAEIDAIVADAQTAYRHYRERGVTHHGGAPELGVRAVWSERHGWRRKSWRVR